MTSFIVTVLAHNEERRIGACLNSLLAETGDFPIHVVVNGSSDSTAEIAGSFGARVIIHNYAQGGKARSWNRYVLDELQAYSGAHIFADGDAEIVPGSLAALVKALADNPAANASAGQPRNGRNVEYYQTDQRRTHGMFGDLYALRGTFLARIKAAHIRLPEDLIGDDGLIGALAKTDLTNEDNWSDDRLIVCPNAGFLCEPVNLFSPHTWVMQYKRMINYSVRYYQNQIITAIMRGPGPVGLPTLLSDYYQDWLGRFVPRSGLKNIWVDRQALAHMKAMAIKRGK